MDRFTLKKKIFWSKKNMIAVFKKFIINFFRLNILFKYFYLNITTEYINE